MVQRNRGFLLVTLLAGTALVSALVLGMTAVTLQASQQAQRQVTELKAYYLAEGGIDHIVSSIRQSRCNEPLGGSNAGTSYRLEGDCRPELPDELGKLVDATWMRPVHNRTPTTMRVFTLTVETPLIPGKPQGTQTITAYVRDQMDPFLFDTLVYTPRFVARNTPWTGNDPDGVPSADPTLDRGNIWTASWGNKELGQNCTFCNVGWYNEGEMKVDNGTGAGVDNHYSTYTDTRVRVDGSVFPVPRFRVTGKDSIKEHAEQQYQRDPLTGKYLCEDSEKLCWDDTQPEQVDNRKNNYYNADRIKQVNDRNETYPTEFWRPQFDPVTVTTPEVTVTTPAVKDPITDRVLVPARTETIPAHTETVRDPETGEPIWVRRPPPADLTQQEANVVMLDYQTSGGVNQIFITQPQTGGFLALMAPPRAYRLYDIPPLRLDPYRRDEQADEHANDIKEMDTIVYMRDPGRNLFINNLNIGDDVAFHLRGALWGGGGIKMDGTAGRSIGFLALSRKTEVSVSVTYQPQYADTIKRMGLAAEPQVLAVHAGSASRGGGPGAPGSDCGVLDLPCGSPDPANPFN